MKFGLAPTTEMIFMRVAAASTQPIDVEVEAVQKCVLALVGADSGIMQFTERKAVN